MNLAPNSTINRKGSASTFSIQSRLVQGTRGQERQLTKAQPFKQRYSPEKAPQGGTACSPRAPLQWPAHACPPPQPPGPANSPDCPREAALKNEWPSGDPTAHLFACSDVHFFLLNFHLEQERTSSCFTMQLSLLLIIIILNQLPRPTPLKSKLPYGENSIKQMVEKDAQITSKVPLSSRIPGHRLTLASLEIFNGTRSSSVTAAPGDPVQVWLHDL